MAVDSGTYDDATLARRAKIAEALLSNSMKPQKIDHWAQGLAQMGQAALGGYLGYQVGEEGRGNQEAADKARLDFLTGGAPQIPQVPANPGANPMGDRVPVANTPPEKIYENDEPSPLDPPSGEDRKRMIATILGESGQEGAKGQNAVASVIRNRAINGGFGGNTPSGVVTAPNQFEPWNTAGGRANMERMAANPQLAAQADAAIKAAYGEGGAAPNDPTNGATHFFAPKAQAALGRPEPAWGRSGGQDIGGHRFFGGANPVADALSGQPTQVAGQVPTPDALPQNAQPAEGSLPQPDIKGRIAKMLSDPNPAIRKMGRTIADQMIGQQFKPKEYDYKERPDGTLVGVNKKDPNDVQIIKAPGGGADAIKFEADKAAAVATAKGKAERDLTAPEKRKQEEQVGSVVVQDIDRAIKTMDSAVLPTTGVTGGILSNIGGTAARDVRALLDTVKANAGFQELSKMRAASPTGGALGSITERELAMLQATIGNLEQSQTAEQLKDNMRRVKNQYLDIIHGPGNGPPREMMTYQGKDGESAKKPGLSGSTKSGVKWSVE